MSSRSTGRPALAQCAAMPLPITPAPSTATRRIGLVMGADHTPRHAMRTLRFARARLVGDLTDFQGLRRRAHDPVARLFVAARAPGGALRGDPAGARRADRRG